MKDGLVKPNSLDSATSPTTGSASIKQGTKSQGLVNTEPNPGNSSSLDDITSKSSEVTSPKESSENAPKEKVAPGKEVNTETGEVKDSSTKRLATTVGRGAAAYATGGKSLGETEQTFLRDKKFDKAVGVVSDQLEKAPGVKETADALDKMGVLDAAEDALNTASDAISAVEKAEKGDIKGAIDSGKSALKNKKKLENNKLVKAGKSQITKTQLIMIAAGVGGLLFVLLIIVGIIGPVAGGFLDLVNNVKTAINNGIDAVTGIFEGDGNYKVETLDNVMSDLASVPDFINLSEERKKVIVAASSAVDAKVGYNTSNDSVVFSSGLDGISSTGLTDAEFVRWALWTGTGIDPGEFTSSNVASKIGNQFTEITQDELLPGDIGIMNKSVNDVNHIGIYAGNGLWYHSTQSDGVIKTSSDIFTVYLRYGGV